MGRSVVSSEDITSQTERFIDWKRSHPNVWGSQLYCHITRFLKNIIAGGEKWVFYDNVQRKKQWIDKDESLEPTSKVKLLGRKDMLCVWWDHRGIIHVEYLNHNQTNLYFQCVHENASHSSMGETLCSTMKFKAARIKQEKILDLDWFVLPHPSYSLDLVPSDFHLFRSPKNSLKIMRKFELKTSLILLDKWRFHIMANILPIEINWLLDYSWENHIYKLNYHDQKIWQTLRATYGTTGQLFRPY